MSHTNYREQMTYGCKSIISEMCEFNPAWSEKDQAGPCWEAAVRSGWGLSPWPWDQQLPGQAGTELDTNTAPAELRQCLRLQGWDEMQPRVLGLWVVVPRGAGQGCAVLCTQDPERTNSPGQRAGVQCITEGLSSQALPHCPGDLGVAPSSANPLQRLWCVRSCRIRAGRAQDHPVQLWAIASVWPELDFCLPMELLSKLTS